MSVAWLMLFGGYVLAVSGWKNISFLEALRGNFDVPKASSASTSSGGSGKGGG